MGTIDHLTLPRIYVIPQETPNAFATGRNPEHAVVAVTNGLLNLFSTYPPLETRIARLRGNAKPQWREPGQKTGGRSSVSDAKEFWENLRG